MPVPTVDLQAGQQVHGFTVTRVTPVEDVRAVAVELTHLKSGAQVMHVHADDPENLFAVGFRTPPPDDTGLPHILEHSVLCGSERYPVKDPFVELLKTSLATFLNAMTYPDKTVYPCASMNEKDFFNLVGVYCDAAFFPRITEMHFKQEGHHLDFEEPGNPQSPLIVKGIVYNEMKGAYSDLDGTIGREESRRICPDNAYGKDSGGNPEAIPELTYAQFEAFHETYYHPANARIFIYGDIPTEKHLAFLDKEYLARFDRIDIDTNIGEQPRWTEPVRDTLPYPIGENEDPKGKTAVTLTWLTNDVADAVTTLAMNVVEYYLLGNAAAPLRKALIDSKFGEELTHAGYADYQRDAFFTVGLKGAEPDRADKIVGLVMDVLRYEIEAGFEAEKLEAAFHRLELASQEIGSAYPLRLMDRVYRSWLYEQDPTHHLRIRQRLAELREHYRSEPRFFESVAAKMLLENPHYAVLTFLPDKRFSREREEKFRARMDELRAKLSDQDVARIVEEARELEAMQGTPNPPEALATLPKLTLQDVSPDPLPLDTEVLAVNGRPLLATDVFSSGLCYLNLAVDLRGLDDELYDYLPLFTEALSKMGAEGCDFVAMAEREAACCGGIHASVSANGRFDDPAHLQPFLTVSTRCLERKFGDMLGVLDDRLLRFDPTDVERLKDVILQGKVHWRSRVVPSGNRFAALRAARYLSRNAALAERFSGITQVRLFEKLAAIFDKERDGLIEKLSRIRDFLHARGRFTASIVAPDRAADGLRQWYGDFLALLRDDTPPAMDGDYMKVQQAQREGVALPAAVAFVASVFPAVPPTDELAPALLLLGQHLSYGYLWQEIRAKRGAYGAHAHYTGYNGVWGYFSYRDPCIVETLQAYAGVADHVVNEMDLSPAGVEQAVIGTVKTLDRPIRPGDAVGAAMARYLGGEDDAFRADFRRRLLSLTGEQIRRAAEEVLRPGFANAPVCVVSSREKLEAANAVLGEKALAVEDL